MFAVWILAFMSCSSTQSLQEYFVDNAENPDFLSIDLPVNMLNMDKADLTAEQKEALASLTKLNVIAFKKTDANATDFQTEKAKVKAILKDNMFNELMKMNTSYGRATINYVGDEDAIDEVVVYGENEEKGFMLVRVLGDNMNPSKIAQFLQTLQKAKYKGEDLGQLSDFFKK